MVHTIIEVADTPAGRSWLDGPNHIHQRLCMAWPDGQTDARMLWRQDGMSILVQTHARPPDPGRWSLDVDFLACRPESSEWEPDFRRGVVYSFALRCNPVRQDASGVKRGLTRWTDIGWWLGRQQAAWGLHVLDFDAERAPAVHVARGADRRECRYQPVEYTGRAVCVDADLLTAAVATGVGKGKAFGLGLLLVADEIES